MSRLSLLLSILLLKHAVAVSNTVTSSPIHVANPNPYEIHEQHQQQPSVLTQSYQVLVEPRNYYPYPQYLPTNTGYTNIQTAGQPYQMYSSDNSYGLSSGSAPGVAPVAPVAPTSRYVAEHQHSSSAEHHRAPGAAPGKEEVPAFIPVPGPSERNNFQKPRGPAAPAPAPAPSSHRSQPTFMIAPKPVLSYGAANPFLANLPPAQEPYGAPLTDAAHREDAIRAFFELNPPKSAGYDGSESASPPASASLDDTWEALEASLDADTRRRRHRFNV